jgi:hypothetical protein
MTNNNGFWIGWLDLLTISFTISHNQITITHNQYSVWSFFLDCRGLPPFLFSFYGWLFSPTDSCYIASGRATAQKLPLLYCGRVYRALPSNGRQKDQKKTPLLYCWPRVLRALPNNGHMRHICIKFQFIITSQAIRRTRPSSPQPL